MASLSETPNMPEPARRSRRLTGALGAIARVLGSHLRIGKRKRGR
jgi:hypothetical protein